jgi:hypothetical protein
LFVVLGFFMLPKCLSILLIPLLLLPPGVCACGAGSHGSRECLDGHDHDRPDSPCQEHQDDDEDLVPVCCPTHGSGPHPSPSDPADQHAPHCPVLKTLLSQNFVEHGKPLLVLAADGVLALSIQATPVPSPFADRLLSFGSPERPLFLILRALLI